MNKERVIGSRTAGTIAANLIMEGGAAGGNSLTKEPEVRRALKHLKKDLRGIPRKQIVEVLTYLSNGHSGK